MEFFSPAETQCIPQSIQSTINLLNTDSAATGTLERGQGVYLCGCSEESRKMGSWPRSGHRQLRAQRRLSQKGGTEREMLRPGRNSELAARDSQLTQEEVPGPD